MDNAGNHLAELRRVRRELLETDDARLRRVVATVDALQTRGRADDLIAPLRPRLAVLRPPRPLTLVRVLFTPVNPLIVPAPEWRADAPAIPRSALPPLGRVVLAALDEVERAGLQALTQGRTIEQSWAVGGIGQALWPQASAALAGADMPPEWGEATGLGPEAFATLARPLALLLGEGTALHRLPGLDAERAEKEAARLLGRAASDPATLAMMLAVLLAAMPQARNLMSIAERLGAEHGRTAPERALDFVFQGIEAGIAAPTSAGHAARDMRHAATLLDELEAGAVAAQRPTRLARITALRRKLQAACRDRFRAAASAMRDAVTRNGRSAGEPTTDADVLALESAAADLRRLDAVGRAMGESTQFDRTLRDTAAAVAANTQLTYAERLHLAELLLGPDAALALVGAHAVSQRRDPV
jgi:hypothetical protein